MYHYQIVCLCVCMQLKLSLADPFGSDTYSCIYIGVVQFLLLLQNLRTSSPELGVLVLLS